MVKTFGRTQPAPPLLKLIALDGEDLAVLSANLQDAVVRVDEIVFLPLEKRFALMLARYDWAHALQGVGERCRSGLHFERVLKAKSTGFDRNARGLVLNLLSMSFLPAEAPQGEITLTFSGGAAIALEVECVEAQVSDMGPRWRAKVQPGHPLNDAPDNF